LLIASGWTTRADSLVCATEFNEELNDYQCMTALEVIEHLPEHTLQRFGAIVLGEYRPSLLLVTTPSESIRG
jgi:hypothetical protein